jgi:diguanylate cyclase (GGDEF)-like protein
MKCNISTKEIEMTKYQLMFIRQFDETIVSWRSLNEPIREADLYRLLHRVKGTAATIGLQEWTDAADRLLTKLTEDGSRLWTMAELEHYTEPVLALRKAAGALGEQQDISNRSTESAAEPLRKSATAVDGEAPAHDMVSKIQGSLVLLVDDDVAFLQLMKERLEQEGCMVLATPYPDKAIKWFYELKPDCIVLDVVMPGHSGFDLLTILQEQSQRLLVPVLLISAQNDTAVRVKAYQSGVDDFISKPFDLNEFAVRVMNKLRRKQAISRIMLTDELTGLYNTQYLRIQWRQVGQKTVGATSYWAALFDIDGFRSLNERYGHAAADGYLHHTAGWLKKQIRSDELLVRWDQDRFVLLGREGTVETIELRLNRVSELFVSHTFEIDGDAVSMSLPNVFTLLDGTYGLDDCMTALGAAMNDIKLGRRNRLSETHTNVGARRRGARRLAVIDDDPLIRNMLERRLGDMEVEGGDGLEIRTFADGEAFFSDTWHHGEHAYLLILDRMMPRMNGMEVLHRLRAEYPADQYRILMLTGIGDETEIAQAIRAGTDDYVTKPFRLPELEARIRRLLQGKSR